MIYVGIDPGLDGAVAVILPEPYLYLHDTPTFTISGNSGNRREYDTRRMAALLASASPDLPTGRLRMQVYIENVHAMPGQGVRSMFTMGYGVGVWEGILAGLGIPYERVTPQRWKKLMLDGMGRDKDASRFKAMQLFPAVADQLKRKKDDGRAEALLIAEYGRRMRA